MSITQKNPDIDFSTSTLEKNKKELIAKLWDEKKS